MASFQSGTVDGGYWENCCSKTKKTGDSNAPLLPVAGVPLAREGEGRRLHLWSTTSRPNCCRTRPEPPGLDVGIATAAAAASGPEEEVVAVLLQYRGGDRALGRDVGAAKYDCPRRHVAVDDASLHDRN